LNRLFSTIESIIGIGGNGIIVAINLTNWVMSSRLSSCDMILIFLSLSILCLQSWFMLMVVCSMFYPAFYNEDKVYKIFNTLVMFLNYSSLWFAAWLSVFYCAKIASFTHLVPWLLVESSLFSLLSSFPFLWDIYNVYCNSMANTTKGTVAKEINLFPQILLYNIGICLSLLVFVASTVLLITSLWRHTRKIENKATGFTDPNMEAHMGAIESIVSFLILYFFDFVALILTLANIFSTNSSWDVICIVVMAAYPMRHSIILILGNPKLKQVSARILHYAKCHLKSRSM
uniref:Taste receptor type 2 n=1 Tax=Chrysemys picta bellii TaxID=8478 RepID=A0A8C3HFX4_CHRPI